VNPHDNQTPLIDGVAIVGMAGRFPGARSVAEFWRNQLDGIESISHFRVEDLEIPDAKERSRDANYVRSHSILEDADLFDADFFGIYPREAELMDPQQRLFLECCWQAFEDAGYDPAVYPGPIGVYAGCSTSTYFLSQLCSDPRFIRTFTGGYQVGNYPEMMGNNLDFLATRVAYKLNLRGPAFTMQAGCSTSLLAVTQACQSLLTYQSDMALAGGSSITFPQKRGSYYQEGGMVSPDGHCRTFDADAQGTVFGSGVAVVLLKRLDDAVRDGDQVYAVIRGFAANNDGSAKVGYTAPSVEGQARVIALAQEAAGIDPQTIGYIEAHGTATPLGDPIELAALTQAFRVHACGKHFCAVGSAKTNVGHLDIAAGVTGLIHASHIVRDGVFPPTLHFRKANPKFDLESSPFYVNSKRSEWKTNGEPRRAGVSAFGVGGTNAHVIIEQAPVRNSEPSTRPQQLLVLSARSERALERMTDCLAEHLKTRPDTNLADAAWTLQAGRRAFSCRRAMVASSVKDAVAALSMRKPMRTSLRANDNPHVNFLFPGQGSQHPNMGHEIYKTERVFRDAVDRCAEALQPHLESDLRTLLYPSESSSEEAKRRVTDTIIAQPAIFTIEYALAQLWMSWGIRPNAMLGHSVGEFVAACLAGVFSLEDALSLVAARGRMMQEIPGGGMLSVRLPEAQLRSRLKENLSLAAVNSPSLCVVSGSFEALGKFEEQLTSEGVACRRLVTSHAFHSAMMDPILKPFTARVEQVRLKPPQIPYVSGVTGTWITETEATDPGYWARHFRQAVQFSAGVTELRKDSKAILLEVGPGNVLATLARQHTGFSADQLIVSSLADGFSGEGDSVALMDALGSLWVRGVLTNWPALHAEERRFRISLPTYPFERKRYWVAARAEGTVQPLVATEAKASETVVELSLEEPHPVNLSSQSPVSVIAPSRANKIRAELVEIFEDLSGMNLADADGSTTFLELGFDSLFLTQVTQALQNKFGFKVTFRQLLGDLGSMNALAEYVDGKLPSDVFSEPSPAPTSPIAPALSATATPTAPMGSGNGDTTTMAESAVDRLVREQLDAMNQLFAKQLETIRGLAPVPIAPTSTATAPAPGNAAKTQQAATPAAGIEGTKELKGYTPFKSLQKGPSGELTPRQVEYIRALVERYTKRTVLSKRHTQEYRPVLADPRVVAGFRAEWKELVYPIVTVRSQGSRLWDVDGNEYIDILNGFGPIMLGHRPAFIEKAIETQLHQGFEIGPQTLLAGEVAKMICEFTGNERATFCNTGSEAVIAAMRVARTVTGRNKVVFFSGDYHGMFDEVLVKGFKKGGVPQAVPIAPGIPRERADNVVVLEYGAPESLEWIRQNAKDLAAVMVEPVQSRHPNLQPIEFLKEIRKITEESQTCLIFDEVVTGFRVHPGGCQALFDIRADLATYGKVLAGGMPIGVLAGKSQYMDALDGGMWQYGDDSYPSVGVTFFAGTFVRHPLAMAAVKAVMQHFQAEGPALQQRLSERTAGMVKQLNDLLACNQVPTHIENFSSIFYFSFPADFRFGSLFYYHLREKGIHLLEGFPCFLTTAHSDADIERIVRAFGETIAEMRGGGALETPAGETAARSAESPIPGPDRDALMTEPQREVFLAAKLADDASCSFNESFSVYLQGPLRTDALRESVNAVIARHEALRATVDAEGNSLHFLSELKLAIPLRDISQMAPDVREAELKRMLAVDARTAFDLTKGPLVRSELLRLEPDYHMLLVTSHHIVCDGWSTNVFLDELAKLYSAKVQGHSANLPETVRFSAYAQEQSAHRASKEGAEVEAYWLGHFKDMPPPLDLPVDRPRPSVKNYVGATYRTHIDIEDYHLIKQLGSKKGCTLFATLLAGFQTLLHRLTSQADIVVGIPAAGQSLLENGNLIGHCVNFLPLRTTFREGLSFVSLLGEVKKTLLDAYDHQSYTYGTLVRKLAIPLDPGRLPLMEVQFNLERIGSGANFEGLKARVDPNPKSAVNFDIFFNVVESDQGLMLDCDYNTDLFDQSTIARWLGHYRNLLLAAASEPEKPVDDLPLMTQSEMASVLAAWNPKLSDCRIDSTIHEIFESQAAQTPDAVAVVSGAERMTYRELNERSNQLARTLRAKGVKPDSLVAVCFERSLEMIVSFLAVLKAGGAYLPIDSSYPKERLAMMLEDARPAVVLTQQRMVANLPEHKAEIVSVDSDWPEIDLEEKGNLPLTARPENLMYVIYTSGSTGKPKGVMVTHANVARLLKATEPWFHFNDQDVWTLFHSYAFDFSVWEIWGSLLTGGRLVVVPYWVTRSPQDFYNLLTQENVTVLNQTPAAFYQVIQVEESGFSKPLSLRYVIFGGEALNFTNLRPWFKRHGDKQPQLVNMYGITETTVHVTYRPITAADCKDEGHSLIGVPIPDLRLYLLDTKQRPVPVGVVGELYVGGRGVARGYLGRPDLTAERFVPDPFEGQATVRMYKSGDLARFLKNGELEYLGRGDTQVKIHGFRVELGEIEAALAQHPRVHQASVTARKEGAGEKKLVAYFVAESGNSPSGTELREFLQEKLPAHMIPYAYVLMESLPLTVNGKVDRDKLPAPNLGTSAKSHEYIAPSTPQETILVDILKEVLHLERVGVTDNLFELGADSLHVFQITSRAAKAGVAVTPRLLLQQRTIASVLAEMSKSPSEVRPQAPAITPVARDKYRVTREVS
jgi:amino acid adenylation domain-containing protein